MGTLRDITSGLNRAWDSVTEGWHELVERAGDALTRFDPSRSSRELETRDEQVQRAGARWSLLAAEVSRDDAKVEVSIEVPGMNLDDFDIHVLDDVLVVRGEKRTERERHQGHYHVMERAYGRFERAVRLPAAVDDSRATAKYRRGVLRITLPISDAGKARRIDVQIA